MSGAAVAQYAVSALLLLLASLVYIYPSIRATSLMYEYSKSLERLEEAKELNRKIKLEISTLRSYGFIEKRAREKLGFVTPAPGQVMIVAKK